MADHYLKSLELLSEIDDLEAQLAAEYAKFEHDRPKIADLHGRLGRCLKLAGVHSELSVRQELQEVANAIRPVVPL